MEISRTRIEVTIYGQKYDLKAPTAMESARFADEMKKELSNVEMLENTQKFLVKMGLSGDVCEQLELDHLNKLIEYITKKK